MTTRTACCVSALFVLCVRLALLPWLPIPEPRYHDEFAYLLEADTFASGRVANPTHPLWEHFEAQHVNAKPSYQAKYPPAPAVLLALGQRLGHPWYGVLLSGALLAAALCWAFAAWMPPGWACAGAMAGMVQVGAGYWMNSYWGGFVPAAGGALVVGAIPRLVQGGGWRTGAMGAIGAVVLAASRPAEGALLCLLACGAVALWSRRTGGLRRIADWRLAAAVAAIGVAGLAGLGWYNLHVSGDPLVMPYTLHHKQYGAAPLLGFQADIPVPTYRHAMIERLWLWDRGQYLANRANPWLVPASLFMTALPYFVPWASGVLFLWGLWESRRGPAAWAMAILAASLVVQCLGRRMLPHYLSPVTVLLLMPLAVGAKSMWERGPAARVLAAVLLAGIAAPQAIQGRAGFFMPYEQKFVQWRRQSVARIEAEPGRHLVIVRYGADHSIHDEYVYNSARIDDQRIVWAREMSPERDARLIAYFSGRRVWLMEVGAGAPVLSPHPAAVSASAPPPESANRPGRGD